MKNILLIVFVFLIQSCSKARSFEKEQKVLNEIKSEYGITSDNKPKVYIVTGLDGCGACMEYTVDFINKNSSNLDLS